MNKVLYRVNEQVYDQCSFVVTEFVNELESQEYYACQFTLNDTKVICRNSKITPKKLGQFVTFWKRNGKGPIEPFHENDSFAYFVVNVCSRNDFGQFVFPKTMLMKKGIVSTDSKEGKRAFRVYPPWDKPISKQAILTQKWQRDYFLNIDREVDLDKVRGLYGIR